MEYIIMIIGFILLAVLILIRTKPNTDHESMDKIRRDTVQEVHNSVQTMSSLITNQSVQSSNAQTEILKQMDKRIADFALENEQKLENIRKTVENRLTALQEDNSKKLDKMQQTVDEKLQKTLEDRIGRSFKLVSDRLEQVYKSLGEMQNLATGVGDLKRCCPT